MLQLRGFKTHFSIQAGRCGSESRVPLHSFIHGCKKSSLYITSRLTQVKSSRVAEASLPLTNLPTLRKKSRRLFSYHATISEVTNAFWWSLFCDRPFKKRRSRTRTAPAGICYGGERSRKKKPRSDRSCFLLAHRRMWCQRTNSRRWQWGGHVGERRGRSRWDYSFYSKLEATGWREKKPACRGDVWKPESTAESRDVTQIFLLDLWRLKQTEGVPTDADDPLWNVFIVKEKNEFHNFLEMLFVSCAVQELLSLKFTRG